MENSKNKFGLGILIGVLATLVIGLTGFIVYDKVLSSEDDNVQVDHGNVDSEEKDNEESDSDTNTDTNTNTSVLKEIPADELEKILAKITVYDNEFGSSYPIKDFNKFATNMSNQDKLEFLYDNITDSYHYPDNFTIGDLERVVPKYFSDNFSYTNENILCFLEGHESLIDYNKETGIYSFNENHPGHGGEGYDRIKSYFIDGSYDETNKEYIINAKVLYGEYCGDVCITSQKYYDSSSHENAVYTNNSDDPLDSLDFDAVYNSVKDKLPITTYRFVKNSLNEIVLKSVK